MELIRKRAYARAGLVGNPSDGYHGRTLALPVRNFWADLVLYEWDDVELVLSQEDKSRFRTVQDLVNDVEMHGYYGGIRLVKATIKKFVQYCQRTGQTLSDRNFSIRYESNIPRQVGLAGSSAIIVATLRCLMEFYGIDVPKRIQPSLALSVETDELGIAAGLQDRVVQVYEGLVAMDFSAAEMVSIDGFSCGAYETLDTQQLPPLYIAYRTDLSGPTEVVHNDLRARFDRGDSAVIDVLAQLAQLVPVARTAIDQGDADTLATLINRNYDLRESICKIPGGQAEMVARARQAGASAKFAGSGGAIIGTCPNSTVYKDLEATMTALGCRIIQPQLEADADAEGNKG